MAGIIAYPMATPEMGDLLLGTEIKEEGSAHLTKNFAMDAIRVLFAQQTPLRVEPALVAAVEVTTEIQSRIGLTDTIKLGDDINSNIDDVYYTESNGRFIFKPGLYYIRIKAQVGNDYRETPASLFFGKFLNGTMIDTPTMISVGSGDAFTAYAESFWLTVEDDGEYMTFGITAKTISSIDPARLQATDPNTNGWTGHSSPFTIDISKVNLV
jgi:hypothetical protein